MAEVQISSWRDIPSLVVARDGSEIAKVELPIRFIEAIDEAAMRLGGTETDAYLEGWTKSEWEEVDGTAADVAASIAVELEAKWSPEAITEVLDGYGPKRSAL